MPGKYGRRYTKRRKFSRRGRAGSLRKQVRRVTRKVRRITKSIETKQFYMPVSTATLTPPADPTTGSFPFCWFIPSIAEGNDYNQREGKKVSLKKLHINLFLRWIPSQSSNNPPTAPYSRARIMIFWDRNSGSTTTFKPSDLFENVTSTRTTGEYVCAPLNWNNRKRFRMIYDKIHALTTAFNPGSTVPAAGYEYNAYQKSSMIFKRLHLKLNKDVFYSGTTSAASDCQKNALWIVACADDGDTAQTYASQTLLTINYRLTYQDL